jgi:hypothetical protein
MLFIGAFFSYFIIFFIIARFISLISKAQWIPTVQTTIIQDAVLAIIFSIIVVS